MSRRTFLWTGLLLGCVIASAEPIVVPFETRPFTEYAAEIVETSGGDLVVRTEISELDLDERTGALLRETDRQFLHFVRPDGTRRHRIELPDAGYGPMVALGDGVALWQRLPASAAPPRGRIVAISATETWAPRVIHHVPEEMEWLYLASSPEADVVYVAERPRQPRMRLTKIDRKGRQVWQKTFETSQASHLTATHDGVALIRAVDLDSAAARQVVTRLSGSGEVMWDAPVSLESGGVGTLLFQRSGFVAVADATYDERHRLTQYDLDTGRIVRRTFIPAFHRLRETGDGVLIWNQLLLHPYVAMIGADGALAWQRRYVAGDGIGDMIDGLITRSGRLAFLSRWRVGRHGQERASLVITDRTARSLQTGRGACTQVDLIPVMELQRRLRRDHAVDISLAFDPNAQDPSRDRRGCARPTDVEYEAFVRDVSKRMGPDKALAGQSRQQIFVHLSAGDLPLQVTHYAVGSVTTHAPERYIALEVRHDASAQFVEHLDSVILPHLNRMQAIRERVFELTGCWIRALGDPDDARAPTFVQDMEQAAQIVYERIAALDRADLHKIQQRRYCGALLVLNHDGFGASGVMQPLESAGETFLRVIEDAWRERQERERLRN